MRRRIFVLIVLILSSSGYIYAQLPAACSTKLERMRTTTGAARDLAIAEALDVRRNASCYAELLRNSSPYINFLKAIEARRTDKQRGTSSGAGASTSLISNGKAARVLSLAAEYGALTQSLDKQVVTIQGSLDGIPKALLRGSVVDYCPTASDSPLCVRRSLLNFLGRFSYGVSFDTSANSETLNATPVGAPQGASQPVVFTANRHQISTVSGRIALWNERDDTSEEYQKKWSETLQAANDANVTEVERAAAAKVLASGGELLTAFQSFLDSAGLSGEARETYDSTYRKAFAALQSARSDQVDARWGRYVLLELLPLFRAAIEQDGTMADETQTFLQALRTFRMDEDDFVDAIAQKPVMVLEYAHNSPLGQKATSTLRIIFDKGFAKKWSVAANGALTFYDAKPASTIPNSRQLRDSQFGFQIQRDLGSLPLLGAASFSTAFYYQFQISPAILKVEPGKPLPGISFIGLPTNATDIFAEKGNLRVAQMRLTLGTNTSVRFPLSISYSNRTELVAQPHWKGQIGISYDFDSLFTK